MDNSSPYTVDRTQAELEGLDRKMRKLITINHTLHPCSDVDRLFTMEHRKA